MGYKVGLVGLSNVGKSSIFNLLNGGSRSLVAPFSYSTIKPVRAMIPFPDHNLERVADLLLFWFRETLSPPEFQRKYIAFELIDIGGITPLEGDDESSTGSSELGPSFLSHIRETDVVIITVRAFKTPAVSSSLDTFLCKNIDDLEFEVFFKKLSDKREIELDLTRNIITQNFSAGISYPSTSSNLDREILFYSDRGLKSSKQQSEDEVLSKKRVNGSSYIDPVLEAQLVLISLIKSDLKVISDLILKYSKKKEMYTRELAFFRRLKNELEEKVYIPLYQMRSYENADIFERELLRKYSFLSLKRIILVCNCSSEGESLEKVEEVREWSEAHSIPFLSINVEYEELYSIISSEEERIQFQLITNGYKSVKERLLQLIYSILEIKTFYTFKLENERGKKYSLNNFEWKIKPIKGEIRAWAFSETENIIECASKVHGELGRQLENARILPISEIISSREGENIFGKSYTVGKNYFLKNGEIVMFNSPQR